MSLEATNRKIKFDIESDIAENSVFNTIALLHPMIQEQYEIAKKHQLIDGLKEL